MRDVRGSFLRDYNIGSRDEPREIQSSSNSEYSTMEPTTRILGVFASFCHFFGVLLWGVSETSKNVTREGDAKTLRQ